MLTEEIGSVVYRALDMMNARAVKEFHTPPDTLIGPGAIARIGEVIAQRGISRAFVVIDEAVDNLGLAEGMFRSFGYAGIDHTLCRQASGEPMSDTVEAAARAFRESQCDGIVAIGGGSALDAAKVVAMLGADPSLDAAALHAANGADLHRAPLIAVPTTAGTGSEATNVAVITDAATHQKRVIVHRQLVPDLALIDACLTLRLPSSFTAATGIDALTHSIEAYVARNATPLTQALAYQAIRMIGEALPIATGRGDDVAARESMALASYMAGVAFSNAGLGLTHSCAHQIGPRYGIPHGMANAIMLPSVMRFNELVCQRAYRDIGLALTGRIMASGEVIDAIQRLIVDLGLPPNLSQVGGRTEDIEAFADAALADYCLATNPRTVSKAQIVDVFDHALRR